MGKLIDFLVGEIFFDIEDLTPAGWVVLIFTLVFALAVAVVSYMQLYPYLMDADINRSNRKAYAFLVIAPLLIAAIAPLCIGIPLLRRMGFNFTKTDADCRKQLEASQLASGEKSYVVFEIMKPTAALQPALAQGLDRAEYVVFSVGLEKMIAFKVIRPSLGKLSSVCRDMRELVRITEAQMLGWGLTNLRPTTIENETSVDQSGG